MLNKFGPVGDDEFTSLVVMLNIYYFQEDQTLKKMINKWIVNDFSLHNF